MKVGLVGPTFSQRSLPFNAQRSINLYPVFDQQGKEVAALYGTPGKVLFSNTGVGPIRGLFASENGRAFGVSASNLVEVFQNGSFNSIGSLDQTEGAVTIAENAHQIAVCDGRKLYIAGYGTRNFIANGNFNNSDGWTLGSGWSIGSGIATATSASAALSRNTAFPIKEGARYKVTFTITRTGGTITPAIGGTNGTAVDASGTYTQEIVAGSSQLFAFNTSSFTGTLDNVFVDTAYQIVDTGFDVSTIDFIDGYFVASEAFTGRFKISALNDGLRWDVLDFATAGSSPDDLNRVFRAVGQLWLFGETTTEIWTNTGGSAFPFRRIAGAVIEVGIVSPFSTVEIDNGVIFLGKDKNGSGIVYKTQGFNPVRISTTPIEKRIQSSARTNQIMGYCYQEEGHFFYVLTGGGLETSLVYDLTTQQWHERAFTEEDGKFGQDLAIDHMFAFGRHLVGDRKSGRIYEQRLDFYDDAGFPLVRERIYTHLSDEGRRIRYNALEVGFETGVGLQSGQGENPLVSLQVSKDGARTWSDAYTASIGRAGDYGRKVEFRRLGTSKQMTFRIRISDPVKVAIIGSYIR